MTRPTAAALRHLLSDAGVFEALAPFSPQAVLVFGSVARGDATERSDLDLLVIGATAGWPEMEWALVEANANRRVGRVIDISPFSAEDVRRAILPRDYFLLGAIEQGILVAGSLPS